MSAPSLSGSSSGATKSAEQFEAFWRQLKECHLNALEELEAKVSKLKKERCLDAQRLEVFHNRNQQLKEQNKTLQDTVDLLEERLRTQECARCAALEEDLKKRNAQKLSLISKLQNEKSSLENETRKLQGELHNLKTSLTKLQQASSADEEDVIPSSPLLPSSLPIRGKLGRHKHPEQVKRVRYVEKPLPWSDSSLFNETNTERVDAAENCRRNEVLVPNTCVLDVSRISADVDSDVENLEEVIPETCRLLDRPRTKTLTTTGLINGPRSPCERSIGLKPRPPAAPRAPISSLDSTSERSPSLLSSVKRFADAGTARQAKRKKGESEPDAGSTLEDERRQHELHQRSSSSSSSSSSGGRQDGRLDPPAAGREVTDSLPPPQAHAEDAPRFKTPDVHGGAAKAGGGKKGKPQQEPDGGEEGGERRQRVEAAWSVDPALALSPYDDDDGEQDEEEEERRAEMADTDCTWISHSVLQRQLESSPDQEEKLSGLGEKVTDSLDMMFDTTAYGEYKSFSGTQLERSQQREEEEEEEEENNDCGDKATSQRNERKAKYPNFPHVAVIRKRDERQKLQGTTCKECEAYYAHLSDEEKQKKLSACSRHRFLYVPPSTPENFWEVGFPSTQTCIDRGYIKEDSGPPPRPRRRQPLTALFSPGKKPAQHWS